MFYIAIAIIVYAYVLWLLLKTLTKASITHRLSKNLIREYQIYSLNWPFVVIGWLIAMVVILVKSLIRILREMKS